MFGMLCQCIHLHCRRSMFVRVRTQIADECNVPGSHARLSSSACLSAKRQLGPKSATTSRPSAGLIACVEACVALTDGWGGGRLEGGGRWRSVC